MHKLTNNTSRFFKKLGSEKIFAPVTDDTILSRYSSVFALFLMDGVILISKQGEYSLRY